MTPRLHHQFWKAYRHRPEAPAHPWRRMFRNLSASVLPLKSGRSDLDTPTSALHEVIPEVPRSVRRTIRRHIKVWVRIIVEPDGSVFAATADRIDTSKYLLRLAIEAARKWTFPPIDSQSQRLIQIRFDFGRHGTTGLPSRSMKTVAAAAPLRAPTYRRALLLHRHSSFSLDRVS